MKNFFNNELQRVSTTHSSNFVFHVIFDIITGLQFSWFIISFQKCPVVCVAIICHTPQKYCDQITGWEWSTWKQCLFETLIKVPQLEDGESGPVHTGRKAECIHWFSFLWLGTVCPWPSDVMLALGEGVCQCSTWMETAMISNNVQMWTF